jgi:hypothetical protein
MKFASLAKYALVTAATIIGLNMMTASKAEAQTVCKVDCVQLRAAYDKLAAKYGVNNKLVKLAKAYLDKVCPPAPTEPRIYECNVLQTATLAVPLGLDASSMLTNSSSPSKIVCTTQAACTDIAGQRFVVQSTAASSRCSASSVDPSIVRLSDADMQTKINQLP